MSGYIIKMKKQYTISEKVSRIVEEVELFIFPNGVIKNNSVGAILDKTATTVIHELAGRKFAHGDQLRVLRALEADGWKFTGPLTWEVRK